MEVLLFALKSDTEIKRLALIRDSQKKSTYCMSIMLPDGAKLSWLRNPELRFRRPKNLERRGEIPDPTLCISEKEA